MCWCKLGWYVLEVLPSIIHTKLTLTLIPTLTLTLNPTLILILNPTMTQTLNSDTVTETRQKNFIFLGFYSPCQPNFCTPTDRPARRTASAMGRFLKSQNTQSLQIHHWNSHFKTTSAHQPTDQKTKPATKWLMVSRTHDWKYAVFNIWHYNEKSWRKSADTWM